MDSPLQFAEIIEEKGRFTRCIFGIDKDIWSISDSVGASITGGFEDVLSIEFWQTVANRPINPRI